MVDTRRMFAAIAVLLFVSGCGGDDRSKQAGESAGFPMTVENCGRKLTIEEPPKRVMTQQADGATLIWAAGAADKIVARSNEAQRPLGPAEEAVRQVPHIAPNGVLSREIVIAQNPDLLISTYWQSEGTPPPEDLKPAGAERSVADLRKRVAAVRGQAQGNKDNRRGRCMPTSIPRWLLTQLVDDLESQVDWPTWGGL